MFSCCSFSNIFPAVRQLSAWCFFGLQCQVVCFCFGWHSFGTIMITSHWRFLSMQQFMLPITLLVNSHTSPEHAWWFERQHLIDYLVFLSIDLKLSDFQSSSIILSITLCIVVTRTKLKRWKTPKDSRSRSWSTQLAFGKWSWSFKIKSYDLCELNACPLVTEFSFWIEFVEQRKWSNELIELRIYRKSSYEFSWHAWSLLHQYS